VIERIHLLGYSPEYARQEFDYLSYLNGFDEEDFPFDQLAEALRMVDVEKVSADYSNGEGTDFGKFFRREMAERLGLELKAGSNVNEGMENLSPYIVLQMLADNPSAGHLPVTWQFADVETGGWARRDEFVKRAQRRCDHLTHLVVKCGVGGALRLVALAP
jgi:hypothetical protein